MAASNISSNRTTQSGLGFPPNFGNMPTGLTIYDHLLILTACCIIIINCYVVSLFVRKPTLRRNSSLLLLSLTMADLFTGVVTVPLLVAATPLKQIDFEEYKIVFILGDFATVLSASLIILSLCAITADRYVRLCYPIKHLIIIQRKRVVFLFCLIWAVAVSYSAMPFIWLHKILVDKPPEEAYARADEQDTRYAIAGAIIFIVPALGLTAAFSHMFYAIHELGRKERRRSTGMYEEGRRCKRERKAIIIFSLMFVAFLICWAPWIILRPFAATDVFTKIPVHLLNVLMLIRFLTSIFNPLMYTLHEADFHRALLLDKDIIIAFLRCQPYTRRGASFSVATDSFHKHSFLKSSRRGTFDKDNSQGDAKDFQFTPITHNGYLHPGDFINHNTQSPLHTGGQGAMLKQDLQNNGVYPIETLMLLPIKVSNDKNHLHRPDIIEEIFEDNTENNDEIILTDARKMTSQKSVYDNVATDIEDDQRAKNGAVHDWDTSKEFVFSRNSEKHCTLEDENRKRQQNSIPQFETTNQSQNEECLNKNGMVNVANKGEIDRKDETLRLLKTSFIGKLFGAEEQTPKIAIMKNSATSSRKPSSKNCSSSLL